MSGTLYRSPNVIIDDHEWHILVRVCHGRTIKQHMWRPLSLRLYRWRPVTAWVGKRPKRFWNFFQPYHLHVERAMHSELVRRDAIAALERRRPNGAAVRNAGVELAA